MVQNQACCSEWVAGLHPRIPDSGSREDETTMMKLGLMKAFFETVTPDWRSPIADEIAGRWFSGGADVEVRRASANFVCEVKTPTDRYFLRFNHESERDRGVQKLDRGRSHSTSPS